MVDVTKTGRLLILGCLVASAAATGQLADAAPHSIPASAGFWSSLGNIEFQSGQGAEANLPRVDSGAAEPKGALGHSLPLPFEALCDWALAHGNELHLKARRTAASLCRSINAQAELWIKIGTPAEASPQWISTISSRRSLSRQTFASRRPLRPEQAYSLIWQDDHELS